MENFPRLVFDEAHSEAWSLSPDTARRINPVNPADASYALAAQELSRRGFDVHAHTDGPLTGEVLRPGDVLVIAHPADRGAERVTGAGSPRFGADELDLIEAFVRGGGGLVVLAECDQDKYGNNLQELLGRFGVAVASTTVQEGARRHQNVATWVLADIGATVGQGAARRRGRRLLLPRRRPVRSTARRARRSSPPPVPPRTRPASRWLRRCRWTRPGRGLRRLRPVRRRLDRGARPPDPVDQRRDLGRCRVRARHRAGRARATTAVSTAADAVELDEHWLALKDAVTRIRPLQSKDGSIDAGRPTTTPRRAGWSHEITARDRRARPALPARRRLPRGRRQVDFARWADGGFGMPDFLDSLVLFQPDQHRVDGLQHLVVFPMYTQNGNPDRNVEALLISVVWPRVAGRAGADATTTRCSCRSPSSTSPPATTPTRRCSSPRRSPCARCPKFTWGAIFCDREAARFRRVSARRRADARAWSCPPDAARLVARPGPGPGAPSSMWDLIHDRTHSHGDLPFDPFMIKQRMPFWLYALEELRCDLTAVP